MASIAFRFEDEQMHRPPILIYKKLGFITLTRIRDVIDKMPKTSISLHQRLTVKIDGKKIFLPHRSRYIDIRDVKGYIEVKTVRGIACEINCA